MSPPKRKKKHRKAPGSWMARAVASMLAPGRKRKPKPVGDTGDD